jgi:fibro-slime domain-containing protein
VLGGACSSDPRESPFVTDTGGEGGTTDVTTSTGAGDGTGSTSSSAGPDSEAGAEPDSEAGGVPKLDLGVPDGGAGQPECGDSIIAVIRDLDSSHPDIAQTNDPDQTVPKTGLVEPQLGPDGDPVFLDSGPGPQITSAASFSQWYDDVPGVNHTFEVELPLTDQGGIWLYDSHEFFPIDGMGWGNVDPLDHNYYFTTEIRSQFVYEGGEVFSFSGDDDFWLFIDNQLVLDLGGLHVGLTDQVALDDLGLQPDHIYSMAIFHAERAFFDSNFRIETTIACLQPEG